jgi:hypothetical protein
VIIVVPTLMLVMLAALTLNKLIGLKADERAIAWEQYKKGLYLVGGVFVVLFLVYISLDYTGDGDRKLLQQVSSAPAQVQEYVHSFVHALREDRQAMFLGSIFRSVAFIVLAAGTGFLLIKGRIKPLLAIGVIGALAFIDLISVDSQYLNNDKYTDEEDAQTPFQPTPADQQVMADKSYYRVFDLREGIGNITNTSSTPYFHLDITGYNPAKLSIYQDLIENQLYKYPNCQPVLDMLNTKYLLLPTNSGRDSAALNPGALGAVWLVRGIRYEADAKAVMDGLNDFDVRDSAVLFAGDRAAAAVGAGSISDTVWLEKNDNDEMVYSSRTASPRFAVFSEVYYNRGWHAYIDNNEAPIIRTNFVLRGLVIPSGSHSIRFEFHPESFYIGRIIQIVASIIVFLLIAVAGVKIGRKAE